MELNEVVIFPFLFLFPPSKQSCLSQKHNSNSENLGVKKEETGHVEWQETELGGNDVLFYKLLPGLLSQRCCPAKGFSN